VQDKMVDGTKENTRARARANPSSPRPLSKLIVSSRGARLVRPQARASSRWCPKLLPWQ
jgi:hypothetical protein